MRARCELTPRLRDDPHTLERDMLQKSSRKTASSRRSPGRQRSSRARRREYEPARPLWERIRMKSWRNWESTSRRASVCANSWLSSSERPQPPPPGVSIRIRSPALRSIFVLPGRLLRREPRTRIFLPVAPAPTTGESVWRDCPPLGEHAHVRIDQAFELANQSVAAARAPAPPEPRRIRYSVMRIG